MGDARDAPSEVKGDQKAKAEVPHRMGEEGGEGAKEEEEEGEARGYNTMQLGRPPP